MAVIGSWSAGALPTVVGAVTAGVGAGPFGGDSLLIGTSAASAFARFEVSTATVAVRWYFRTPSAWASASVNAASLRPSGSVQALTVAFGGTGAPGQLRVVKTGGGIVASSPSGTLELGTLYRFEVRYDGVSGDASWECWAVEGSAPLWSGSVAALPEFQLALTRVELGRVNNTPTLPEWGVSQVVIDSDASVFVGRHVGDVDPGVPPAGEDYPIVFDGGTTLSGAAPELVGGGVGSHGRERLVVAPADGTLWPGPGAFTVDQGDATAYAQYALAAPAPVLHVVTWLRVPDVWADTAWGAVSLRPNPAGLSATVTISGTGQKGQLRLTTAAGATVASTAGKTISAGGLYRLELLYDSVGSRARLGMFLPQSPLVAWDTGWCADAGFADPVSLVQFGRVNVVPEVGPVKYGRWRISDVLPDPAVTGSPWLGYDPAVEGRGLDELWDGTTLLPLDPVAELWDGATLIPMY